MAASTDPMVEVGPRIWIARPRTDRAAIFRTSASKTFNAAALVVVSVVTVLAVADLVAVIASAAVEDSVAAALAGLAVALADSGVGGNN